MPGDQLTEILSWDFKTLSAAYRERRLSPLELTRMLLARIETHNSDLNAFVSVWEKEALAAAAEAEAAILAGRWRGLLHGVPVGLKDLIYTKNARTTMGSEIYKDFLPDYDAAVVERLNQAGAVILGKLNTHQFAYGPTGDRSYFGPVKNPYDRRKMTGGSSSGAGAAVAAGLCLAALGTDTGGSVRIPAACCGLVGMKPTFGRVSKHGVYPLGWTLDHVGPMTRRVFDNAALLNALAGPDARDPYSVDVPAEDFSRRIGETIAGAVIGIPTAGFLEAVEPAVGDAFTAATKLLATLGAEIRAVDLPDWPAAIAAQRTILSGEAFAVHRENLATQADRYEQEVKERLLPSATLKAYEYIEAQQHRHVARRQLLETLEKVDVVVLPTLPILPPDIDQREIHIKGQADQVRAALLRFTSPINMLGFPAMSLPCGLSAAGLPVGLQIIGRPFDEANIYRFGGACEQAWAIPAPQL